MGWDFFFVYSHHFSPPSALSSHLACTFSFPNRFVLIHLFYKKNLGTLLFKQFSNYLKDKSHLMIATEINKLFL